MSIGRLFLVALLGLQFPALALLSSGTLRAQQPASGRPVAALSPFIDVHTHIEKATAEESIAMAIQAIPTENSAKYLFLPSPFEKADSRSFDIEVLQMAARGRADKLSFIGGGGTLNPMLVQAVIAGSTSPALEKAFKARAEEIASKGAVGFGELTMEHRPSVSTPSYQSAPPDHPLLMVLADIAAAHNIPIALHMEAVTETMPLPDRWRVNGSGPAPSELRANIPQFERLLSHNARAKIVWAHAGWDNTGLRTPALLRRLMAAHRNLFLELKIDPLDPGLNSPLSAGATGTLKPDWLKLFQDFPDRFVIGSDQHYPMPNNGLQRWQAIVLLFNQLPPGLRRTIGTENATRIYNLQSRN